MSLWTSDPCVGDAAWTGLTVCRRPYGAGPYGLGPYGRCAIVGGDDWAVPTDGVQTRKRQTRTWRRRRG